MLILLDLNGQTLPVMAPMGAAAYMTQVKDTTASVLFAMMQKGEDGLDTLNRVLDTNPNWLPVAARPEEQTLSAFPDTQFVSYDFVYKDGNWEAATVELANFLSAMSSLRSMPKSPPVSLSTNLDSFLKTGKAAAKR